jgi:hypothetical protein
MQGWLWKITCKNFRNELALFQLTVLDGHFQGIHALTGLAARRQLSKALKQTAS